jgi:hypothetical protein
MFSVLGFPFNLILLGAFLAFSSLGAGSDKRMRKPLGAHQENFSIANEREHRCCDLQPNYVSCIGNSTSLDLLHQCIISFASFHSYQSLTSYFAL